MYNTLKEACYSTGKNLDSDLIDLVKQGTPGVFSKDFLSQLQSINSKKYDDYISEMMPTLKKSFKNAEVSASESAEKAIKNEFIENVDYEYFDEAIRYKQFMTQDVAIDSVMRTTLFDAMKEMSTAAEKAASTELARSLGYVALKKSFSQILWKYTIRNGGLISIDVHKQLAFGLFNYNFDISLTTEPNRQFSEKWWANQEAFGYELWDAGDLGLTETDDSEYWDEAYVEGDGTDDDYWYYSVADDSSSSTTDSSSSGSDDSTDDDDDDYWYGTDTNADAAE